MSAPTLSEKLDGLGKMLHAVKPPYTVHILTPDPRDYDPYRRHHFPSYEWPDCEECSSELERDDIMFKSDVEEWNRSGGKKIVINEPDIEARTKARAAIQKVLHQRNLDHALT